MSDHILTVHIEEYKDIELKPLNTIPQVELLINNDNINKHSTISFWNDIQTKYYRNFNWDTVHTHDYNLIDLELFNFQLGRVRAMYEKLYKNQWFNKNQLTKDDIDMIDMIEFKRDLVFGQLIDIETDAQILLVGDFHSGFFALIEIIKQNHEFFIKDSLKLKENRYMIFLGDLIDRGPYNLEILYLAFQLKLLNENRVYIINGNHEDIEQWNQLLDQWGRVIMGTTGVEINKTHLLQPRHINIDTVINLNKTLWYLPSVIYLKYDNKTYHLSHGMFDIRLLDLDDDAMLKLNIYKNELIIYKTNLNLIDFLKQQKSKLVYFNPNSNDSFNHNNQYKWGDMIQDNWDIDSKLKSFKSGRYLFSEIEINNYLTKYNIECILSGHQDRVTLGLVCKDSTSKQFQEVKHKSSMKQNPETKIIAEHNFIINNGIPLLQRDPYNMYTGPYKDNELISKVTFSMKPKEDFLALVTSTAIPVFNLQLNNRLVWLILSNTKLAGPVSGGGNINYIHKYRKYKTKYLKNNKKYL